MFRILILLLIFVWFAPGSTRAQSDQKTKTPPAQAAASTSTEFEFPKDPKTPVLQFNFLGGYRFVNPKGFEREPRLRIYADGTVICGRFEARMKQVKGKLSEAELKEILNFVVVEHKLPKITTEEINQKIKNSGVRPMVADAPTSQFNLNLNGTTHSVEVYAVAMLATYFRNVDELKSILAIQEKLRVVYNKALAGKDAGKVLAAVNQAQKEEAEGLPPFTLEQLDTAAVYQSGKRSFSFYRVDRDEKNNSIIRTVRGHYLQRGEKTPTCTIQVSDYTQKKKK